MVCFEGVDYVVDVWINGVYFGYYVGYFELFEFDVMQYVRVIENLFVVCVDFFFEKLGDDWLLCKSLIKGIFLYYDI